MRWAKLTVELVKLTVELVKLTVELVKLGVRVGVKKRLIRRWSFGSLTL